MTPLTATATGATPAADALILLVLTAWLAGYLAACWLWPFTTCRRCSGTGRNRSPFGGRTFGLCRRCDGTGRQLRAGRHVLNHLRNLHDKGTKR